MAFFQVKATANKDMGNTNVVAWTLKTPSRVITHPLDFSPAFRLRAAKPTYPVLRPPMLCFDLPEGQVMPTTQPIKLLSATQSPE